MATTSAPEYPSVCPEDSYKSEPFARNNTFPFSRMGPLTLRANSSALTSSLHCILFKCSLKISRLDARSGGLTYNIRSIRPGLSKAESYKAYHLSRLR
jgi:hypothetical protein